MTTVTCAHIEILSSLEALPIIMLGGVSWQKSQYLHSVYLPASPTGLKIAILCKFLGRHLRKRQSVHSKKNNKKKSFPLFSSVWFESWNLRPSIQRHSWGVYEKLKSASTMARPRVCLQRGFLTVYAPLSLSSPQLFHRVHQDKKCNKGPASSEM